MKFTISETDEMLVSHSGLALAGALLQRTSIQKRADSIRLGDRKRPDVSHGDVVTAMIGLLCLGKPDFEAIEAFRGDEFFRQALSLWRLGYRRSPISDYSRLDSESFLPEPRCPVRIKQPAQTKPTIFNGKCHGFTGLEKEDQAMPDGTRKRRFSPQTAKRLWYARHRALRFRRRFGLA